MGKKLILAAALAALAALALTLPALADETAGAFRQQNGLIAYSPPDWFLAGDFVARETRPGYAYGPVADFVKALKCPAAWLIEDVELKRLQAAKPGRKLEYPIYLEAAAPGGTVYWVFVVLPHDNAQEWFQARWQFHRNKAEAYYGQTRRHLQQAMDAGLKITGELRFIIEKGQVSLRLPEDAVKNELKLSPVYDLEQGRRLAPATGQ